MSTSNLLHTLQLNQRNGGIIMDAGLKKKLLFIRIRMKKISMYKKAKNPGFTHPCVVECSHELDILLNKVQGI